MFVLLSYPLFIWYGHIYVSHALHQRYPSIPYNASSSSSAWLFRIWANRPYSHSWGNELDAFLYMRRRGPEFCWSWKHICLILLQQFVDIPVPATFTFGSVVLTFRHLVQCECVSVWRCLSSSLSLSLSFRSFSLSLSLSILSIFCTHAITLMSEHSRSVYVDGWWVQEASRACLSVVSQPECAAHSIHLPHMHIKKSRGMYCLSPAGGDGEEKENRKTQTNERDLDVLVKTLQQLLWLFESVDQREQRKQKRKTCMRLGDSETWERMI